MRSRSAVTTRVHIDLMSLLQIAMALPLLLGIVPESLNETALFDTLISNIVDVNLYHVTTVRTKPWVRWCVCMQYIARALLG